MKITFINKINRKKIEINNSIFIFRYQGIYLFEKKNETLEFFTTANSNQLDFDFSGLGFDNYEKKLISYIEIDEILYEFFLIEISYMNPITLKKSFFQFSELPPKESFLNSILAEKLIKKLCFFEKQYYIYILRCKDNSLYTGIATDYKKRYNEHKIGTGAKYTKTKGVLHIELVYQTAGKSSASKIEYFIKQFKKEKKEDLLKNTQLLLVFFPELTIVQKDN